jgi:ABC-2 type transport system permease protein
MSTAFRSELRKILSVRIWWILALGMFAYMAFLGGVLGLAIGADDPDALDGGQGPIMIYSLATALGYVFPLVLGALIWTTEFRHKTATPTFLAEPRRLVVAGAKLATGLLMGLLIGFVGVAGTLATAVPAMMSNNVDLLLDQGETWATLGLSVVALALWCVLGVAVGTLLTNQVAAIVAILAFTQFVEPLLRLSLSAWKYTAQISQFLPGAAAEALSGSSVYSTGMDTGLLSRPAGAAVMLAWIAACTLMGWRTSLRRDLA